MSSGTLWRPYTQMLDAPPALEAVATEGARITLADGRELVDGTSSWWTACHGYNHPHILAAMERQLGVMPHVMFGGLTHAPAETLADRLAVLLPGDLDHVFLVDSGSVAVEVALKMAVQFWRNQGAKDRQRFVCFRDAYHGDTLGAMSVCDPADSMHALFAGYLPEQYCLNLPRDEKALTAFDRFLADHKDSIAGVIIEPLVQAAAGMRFHDADVLRGIYDTVKRHDLLFIADEVATGFGRTGSMFAIEQADIVPDIICLGKGLSGGVISLAATVAGRRVFGAFQSALPEVALMHGPTYMANPLAAVAACASLDLFEAEPRLRQVAAIEAQLADQLASCTLFPGVVDVRVKGAIGVVQLSRIEDLDGLKACFVEEGVWLRPFRDVVYIMPAFTIDERDLSALTGAVCRVLGSRL